MNAVRNSLDAVRRSSALLSPRYYTAGMGMRALASATTASAGPTGGLLGVGAAYAAAASNADAPSGAPGAASVSVQGQGRGGVRRASWTEDHLAAATAALEGRVLVAGTVTSRSADAAPTAAAPAPAPAPPAMDKFAGDGPALAHTHGEDANNGTSRLDGETEGDAESDADELSPAAVVAKTAAQVRQGSQGPA
jgi:hypothetical protein